MRETRLRDVMPAQADVDRAGAGDLFNLAVDIGPVPMQVGACLVLDTGPRFDLKRARRLIAERVGAVPRLRQRLVPAPPGCGRPLWIDDPAFDIDHHLHVVACPPPGDDDALLDLAAAVIGLPLAPAKSLWSVTLVTGLAGHRLGMIACFHHVLADGLGGLAVLGCLMDGAPTAVSRAFPLPAPSLRRIAADAWTARLRALARLPHAGRAIRRAAAEFGAPRRVARSSLNEPVGAEQRIATVTARLDDVRRFAHAHGGTVNDAMLSVITGAVRTLLDGRGESIPDLVVSVPVSARGTATTARLGNQIGVMPVRLPTEGDLGQRLERIATITRARKSTAPGASAEPLANAGRLLARLHLVGRLFEHQRLIHTAVTNLRGPQEPLSFGGADVLTIIPISLARGNVTVAFSVLSYVGTLVITIVADAARTPDLPVLTGALHEELTAMSRTGPGADRDQGPGSSVA
ncbi:wax ester/triacylglycerol synthase domain-containing protein [Nonomuraea sp. CA-143628]|uniref:wax ester/triacylglycerol synthase domain-containing protein n=1 Tax=Nonomuraea sp. CA-143628 TaxID=3239997 RepID=UPI003D93DFF2